MHRLLVPSTNTENIPEIMDNSIEQSSNHNYEEFGSTEQQQQPTNNHENHYESHYENSYESSRNHYENGYENNQNSYENNQQNPMQMFENMLKQSSVHSNGSVGDTAQLPSDPQVMRSAKRSLGHRKAQSVSYSVGPIRVGPGHQRTASLTGGPSHETSAVSGEFIFNDGQRSPHSNSNSSGHLSMYPYPPAVGILDKANNSHRRFHSMSSMQNGPYSFQHHPHSAPMSPGFAGHLNPPIQMQQHQKNVSGTTAMFDEFDVMDLKNDEMMMPPGMRPLRRLHPLMNEHSHDTQHHMGYVPQPPAPQYHQQQPYFDNSAAINNERGFYNNNVYYDEGLEGQDGDDFNQIVTVCGWEGCNIEMHTQDALVSHILQDHVGTGKASYICGWVGCSRMHKPFTKRHKIQNHVRIHTGERPFACPVADCGKKFSRQDGLNTHIKTHSSVKPYVCSFPSCGKAYFHSRSLKKHERTHIDGGGGDGGISSQFIPETESGSVNIPSFDMYPTQDSTYGRQFGHHPTNSIDSSTGADGYLMELASAMTNQIPQSTTFYNEHQQPAEASFVWNAAVSENAA